MEIGLRSDEGAVSIPILGSQEMPKAFAIIPWKRSELLERPSARRAGRMSQGHEIELFMRLLSYEVRSEAKCQSGPPTKMNATQLATAAHRRKS